jgi:hypothetical protein
LVAKLIGSTPALSKLFEKPKASVCCIGGGPGSDLVGVLKHVESAEIDPKLMFWLFDREQAWSDSWADLNDKLDHEISTCFIKFDVTDPETWTPHLKYLQSDLFIMMYFLSEVHHAHKEAGAFFKNVFAKAKKGAHFLYIDNSASEFYDEFDNLWTGAGLTKVDANDSVTMKMPLDEQTSDLGGHLKKMGGWPKLDASIAYRVLRKD